MLFTLHPLLVTLFERLAIRDFFLEHEHHFTPTGRGAADCQEIMNRAIAPETDAVTIARRRLPPLAACRGISPPPVDRARPGRFFSTRVRLRTVRSRFFMHGRTKDCTSQRSTDV